MSTALTSCFEDSVEEFAISGNKLGDAARSILRIMASPSTTREGNGPYDLVVTCSDVYLQKNIRANRNRIGFQEGIMDPES